MTKSIIKSHKYALLILASLWLSPAHATAEHDLQSPFTLDEKAQKQTIKLTSSKFHYLTYGLKIESTEKPIDLNLEITKSITEFAEKGNYSSEDDLILNWMLTHRPDTRINLWSSLFGFSLLFDGRINWETTEIPITSMSLADYMKTIYNKHKPTQSPDHDYETIISALKPLDEQSKLTKLEEERRYFQHGSTTVKQEPDPIAKAKEQDELKELTSSYERLKKLEPESPEALKLIERNKQIFNSTMQSPLEITTGTFYPQDDPSLWSEEKTYPANEMRRRFYISQRGLVFAKTDVLWVKKITEVGELSEKESDEACAFFPKEELEKNAAGLLEHVQAIIQQKNAQSKAAPVADEYHIITKTSLDHLLVGDSSK